MVWAPFALAVLVGLLVSACLALVFWQPGSDDDGM